MAGRPNKLVFETALARLKDQIENGIINDLIAVEEAIFLLNALDPHCDSINEAGFGHLVSVFQRLLSDQIFVVLPRVFEPEKAFDLRSLPAVIKLLHAAGEQIPIRDRDGLRGRLLMAGLHVPAMDDCDASITRSWTAQCRKTIKTMSRQLAALKTIRDKRIAHHEQVGLIEGQEWAPLLRAVEYAKQVMAIVDHGYLSGSYIEADGSYPLTEDARRTGRSMIRLLQRAGLTNTPAVG